jgi:hypothetical protein
LAGTSEAGYFLTRSEMAQTFILLSFIHFLLCFHMYCLFFCDFLLFLFFPLLSLS